MNMESIEVMQSLKFHAGIHRELIGCEQKLRRARNQDTCQELMRFQWTCTRVPLTGRFMVRIYNLPKRFVNKRLASRQDDHGAFRRLRVYSLERLPIAFRRSD